jgi:hypothetical protein
MGKTMKPANKLTYRLVSGNNNMFCSEYLQEFNHIGTTIMTNPMEFFDNITAAVAINRKYMIVTTKFTTILWLVGMGTFNTWLVTDDTD